MQVNLVFQHKCGPSCAYAGSLVICSVEQTEDSSFVMPDVRCVLTNNELLLISINGRYI